MLSRYIFITLFCFITVIFALPDDIPVTTSSDKAKDLFIKAEQLNDNVRINEARELFKEAIEIDPAFTSAHYNLAITSSSTTEFQKNYKNALKNMNNASEGEQLLIKILQANIENNDKQALALTKQLVEKYPKSKRAHMQAGFTYFNQNLNEEAKAHIQKAIAIDGDFAPVYNQLGYIEIALKNYEAAEVAFKKYIALIPGEANPYDSLADLYFKMGKFDLAIQNFSKAVELNPKLFFSQRKIGLSHIFQGNYDEGRKALEKANTMEDESSGKVTDMNLIAVSYVYQDNLKMALKKYDESMALAKKENYPARIADIHNAKCTIFREMGNYEEAEQNLQSCMKVIMASDFTNAIKNNWKRGNLYNSAMLEAKKKNFDKALEISEEYKEMSDITNNPNNEKFYHTLMGRILFEKGDMKSASEHLNQGNMQSPVTLFYLALVDKENGNAKKSKTLMKEVAQWNQNSLGYALIKNKAAGMVN